MSRSASMPIDETVRQAITQIFGSPQNCSITIGVSGGADSMCLLHVLHELGVELYVVHINYQKRGPDSDKDAQLVEEVSSELSIDCEIITVEPDEAEGANFQQWARQVRYNALQLRADTTASDAVAVAHHRDDQIETILQKIFRGGGMASWSAMQRWDGRLFRPLLEVSREDIEAYCREHAVHYRDDESNFTSDFARNFLRNEWLPQLDDHFPGWQVNVLRASEQARIFQSSLRYVLDDITDDKDRLSREAFLTLDEGLQKSIIIHYALQIDPELEISRHALDELHKLKHLQTGKGIQLNDALTLLRDREHFKLVVETGDLGLKVELSRDELSADGFSFNGLVLGVTDFGSPDYAQELFLDADQLAWPVTLRQWKSGDQFQPFGMEGHQSVADHLANRKVSAAEKDNALVVESFEETICAVIFPPIENRVPPGTISECVKCSPSTRKSLIIKRGI